VRYRDEHSTRELPADLVVGSDGRFSKLRRLADLPARSLGASSDLLWFRLSHHDTDPPDADVDLFFGRDHYVGLLAGPQGWQVGYSLPKAGYPAARDAGVAPIRRFVDQHIPWLSDRTHLLTDFAQTTLLSVDISRVRQGLLLISDAAHVISPVGGAGILMAVQDVVVAANPWHPRCWAPACLTASSRPFRTNANRPSGGYRPNRSASSSGRRVPGKPGGRSRHPRCSRWSPRFPGGRRAARSNAYGPVAPVLDAALAGRTLPSTFNV
jgi:FAD binding domain